MFLGGIGDFLFPNLIGIVMNAMKDGDKVAVASNLGYWLIIIVVGALSTMIQGIMFGVVSERIGNSLRIMLFTSLLKKDVAFYDDNRTGELRKFLYFNINSFSTCFRHVSSLRWIEYICCYVYQQFCRYCCNGCNHVYIQLEVNANWSSFDYTIIVCKPNFYVFFQ